MLFVYLLHEVASKWRLSSLTHARMHEIHYMRCASPPQQPAAKIRLAAMDLGGELRQARKLESSSSRF